MDSPTKLYLDKLKRAGRSNTRSRLTVFNVFLRLNHQPLSPTKLVNITSGELNRSTVYRNLELLEKMCVIKKVNIGWQIKYELSEDFQSHHHHLTCLNCGHIITPVDWLAVENAIQSISLTENFKPMEHSLEIRGYCKKCS